MLAQHIERWHIHCTVVLLDFKTEKISSAHDRCGRRGSMHWGEAAEKRSARAGGKCWRELGIVSSDLIRSYPASFILKAATESAAYNEAPLAGHCKTHCMHGIPVAPSPPLNRRSATTAAGSLTRDYCTGATKRPCATAEPTSIAKLQLL